MQWVATNLQVVCMAFYVMSNYIHRVSYGLTNHWILTLTVGLSHVRQRIIACSLTLIKEHIRYNVRGALSFAVGPYRVGRWC